MCGLLVHRVMHFNLIIYGIIINNMKQLFLYVFQLCNYNGGWKQAQKHQFSDVSRKLIWFYCLFLIYSTPNKKFLHVVVEGPQKIIPTSKPNASFCRKTRDAQRIRKFLQFHNLEPSLHQIVFLLLLHVEILPLKFPIVWCMIWYL